MTQESCPYCDAFISGMLYAALFIALAVALSLNLQRKSVYITAVLPRGGKADKDVATAPDKAKSDESDTR